MSRHCFAVLIIIVSCVSCVAACKKERPPPPVPTVARPIEPAKPTYSREAAAKELAALKSCKTEVACPPMDRLVAFGTSAGPELLAYVSNPSNPRDQREIAAVAIGKIKLPGAGPKLVELGDASDNTVEKHSYYEAAGACGGDDTFAALIATYETNYEAIWGLKAFPEKSLQFAVARLKTDKKNLASWASLITDVAPDADTVIQILITVKPKNVMANNRLAAKAIELGSTDERLFDILIVSLQAPDKFDRFDAVNQLMDITAKIPVGKRAKVLALTKQAIANEPDRTYSDRMELTLAALEKLGA